MKLSKQAVWVEGGVASHPAAGAAGAMTGVEALGRLGRVNPMQKFGFSLEATVWYTVSGVLQYYQDGDSSDPHHLDPSPPLAPRPRCSSYQDQLFVEWLATYPLHDKPTSELQQAIQLGIGQSIGGLSSKPERDVLMQDFAVVEVVFFPSEGSNLTPAHHCSDFRFKTYAPVAFRYFRDLFGIQPEDFMLSLCADPLQELSNPGASGSIFYCTHDDEFIIKTVQHKEADFLQKLLPGYFLNISQNKRTLLPKFYGLYCYQCGGKNIRFVVMNNLLPSTVHLHEKYDLKGSTYKRKASKHERAKNSPTLKDLDFLDLHNEGLLLERDTYEALIKTLQRDCRVLESFKIMDYSLLVGVYNLDQASREKSSDDSVGGTENATTAESAGGSGENKPARTVSLTRGKSFKTRIGQYSTPMESIQANAVDKTEDEDVPPGGIPARNAKGERLLLYLGIIDILQSFRLKKRLEHTMKAMVIDGDTISVHRPSFYAQRFLNFMASRVFKKMSTALKHSPSKKKGVQGRLRTQTLNEEMTSQQSKVAEKTARTISFSDEPVTTGVYGGKPDLVADTQSQISRLSDDRQSQSMTSINTNGTTDSRRSEMMTLATYQSEEAMMVMGGGGGVGGAGMRYPGTTTTTLRSSPPLSLSESTPTHTDHTEGTPSFTASSPSCSSEVLDVNPSGESTLTTATLHPHHRTPSGHSQAESPSSSPKLSATRLTQAQRAATPAAAEARSIPPPSPTLEPPATSPQPLEPAPPSEAPSEVSQEKDEV